MRNCDKIEKNTNFGNSIIIQPSSNLKEVLMKINCIDSGIYINKLKTNFKYTGYLQRMESKIHQQNFKVVLEGLKINTAGVKFNTIKEFTNLVVEYRQNHKSHLMKKQLIIANSMKLTMAIYVLFGVSVLKNKSKV